MRKHSPLLLDTHIWIWLMDGVADKISVPLRARISDAAGQGLVYISAISVWEVAILDQLKKLTLSVECRTWVDRALEAPGVQFAPLTPAIMIDSTRLPGEPHRDPADRMLIATARSLNGTLVTRDPLILEYSVGGYVKTLSAER